MSLTSFTPEAEHVAEIRRQLQRFVEAKAPREKRRQWDREHTWPRDLFAELADMGIQLKDGKNPETGEIETSWEVRR